LFLVIAFLHIPKTAGTSFKSLLRANFGIRCVESNKVKRSIYTDRDLKFARKVFIRIGAVVGHNLKNPVDHLHGQEITLLTFLRQPVDRCISHYQDRVIRNGLTMTFEEWISLEDNQNLMVRLIAGSQDLQRAKEILAGQFLFIGFTERFEESLKLLNSLLDKPLDLSYRTSIRSRSNHVREEIIKNQRSMELAVRHNELDQQLYDFAFSELYLPLLSRHSQGIEKVTVISDRFTRKQRLLFHSSIRYNKMIYRPLVKILDK